MASSLRLIATYSGKAYRSAVPPVSRISSIFTETPSNSFIRSVFCRTLCTAKETEAQFKERAVREISYIYEIEMEIARLRYKMALSPWGSDNSVSSDKTEFGVKLVDFSLSSKVDVMEEIKKLTCLSDGEVEELMEKTPAVVKKGLTRKEAFKIMVKLSEVGATVELA